MDVREEVEGVPYLKTHFLQQQSLPVLYGAEILYGAGFTCVDVMCGCQRGSGGGFHTFKTRFLQQQSLPVLYGAEILYGAGFIGVDVRVEVEGGSIP